MTDRKTAPIKVGLVQINNSFSGQSYLPYSVGLLEAYVRGHAKDPAAFEFMLPIFNRIKVDAAVEHLSQADVVGISLYVWNERLSLEIARRLLQFGWAHIVGRRIDEIAPEENAFGDITHARAVHGFGQNKARVTFLAGLVAVERIGAERPGQRRAFARDGRIHIAQRIIAGRQLFREQQHYGFGSTA